MSKPYKTCPYCGCHLDFGETCDCEKEREASRATEHGTGSSAAQSAGSRSQTTAREARKNSLSPVLRPGA